MPRIEKSVFISYRRTDSYHALATYQYLLAQGYDVFLDVDSLRGGDWLKSIIDNIKARAHFLIILTPNAVERFSQPDDVMRLEIETAIESRRNITPLMMEDFSFSQAQSHLTGKLAILSRYNGLEISPRFFRYAMQELHEQRLQQPTDTIIHPPSPEAEALAAQQKSIAQLTAEQWFEKGKKSDKLTDRVQAYTEAIHLKPRNSPYYNNRGATYGLLGHFDEAIRDFNKAIDSNVNDPNTYFCRAFAKEAKGDKVGAISDYEAALHFDPEHELARKHLKRLRGD